MADKDFIVKNGLVTGSNTVTIGTAVYHVSNGNVGFGTSTPGNKIAVSGSITATANISSAYVNASSGFTGTVLTATQATIDHNSLSNYVANKHIDHTTVSISAGNGLSGGGDISSTRTLSVTGANGVSVTAAGVNVLAGNNQLIANSSGLWTDQSKIDHNSLSNYVANKHIDHTTVSISSGNGLSGGGDISSTRTLSVTGANGVSVTAAGVNVLAGNSELVSNSSGTWVGSTIARKADTTYIGTTSIALNRSSATQSLTGVSIDGSAGSATNATYATYAAGAVSPNSGTSGALRLIDASGNPDAVYLQAVNNAQNSQYCYLKFNSDGSITSSGDVTVGSDIKIKENIEQITDALSRVKQIRGVTYNRIGDINNRRQSGVIAQEVESVLPEVVIENNGIKSVAYGNMVGLLIEAIKEQQQQIEELKTFLKNNI